MALLPIVKYPNPVLAQKAEPITEITDEIKSLAQDMAETMYKAPGVGLAAPQIGKLLRLIVIDVSDEKNDLHVFINPVVTPVGEETVVGEEGCLSLPDLYEKVKRPAKVRLQAIDLEGKKVDAEYSDIMAICVQHECDHLEGKVFIDRLSLLKKSRAQAKLAKIRKEKAREAKRKENEN